VRSRHSEIVEILAGYGASLDVRDKVEGRTPLVEMASHFEPFLPTSTIKVLVGLGASVDASDSHGRTALHHAASELLIDNVEALLGAGARRDVVDSEGLTPLHLAAGALGKMVQDLHKQPSIPSTTRGRHFLVEKIGDVIAQRDKFLRQELVRGDFQEDVYLCRSTVDLLADLLTTKSLLGEQDVVGRVLFGGADRTTLSNIPPLNRRQRAFALPHTRILVEAGALPLDLFSAVYLGMPEVMDGIVDKWVAGGGSRDEVLEATLGGYTPLRLACSLGATAGSCAIKLIALGAKP